MEITGETLERAMAVLEGRPTVPEPEPEHEAEPADEGEPAVDGEPEAQSDEPDEPGGTGTDSEAIEGDVAAARDVRRAPGRRSHLRGL